MELQQLLPQPKADFQANMARDHRRRPLTPEALNRHYEHTNTKRLEDLRSILRACALSAKAEASRARHAEEVMQVSSTRGQGAAHPPPPTAAALNHCIMCG